MEQELLGFPLWLRINHFINLFCILVLMRSGVQILADHPKLYWNDDTTPGSEWIKFGKKVMPRDRSLGPQHSVESNLLRGPEPFGRERAGGNGTFTCRFHIGD